MSKKVIDCEGRELIVYHTFEIPKNSHPLTKKILRLLERDGVVYVVHDDGWSRIAREEIEEIAGAIGLTFIPEDQYQYILMTEEAKRKFLHRIY